MTQADAARTAPRPLRPDAAPLHNLPAPATPLLGREAALREATALLERPEVRLLTLTGSGGSGKTRLALAVAEALVPAFAAGVWFVPLAAVAEPDFVPAAIAAALGVREAPGQPLLTSVQRFLRERPLLLVLDNFEHLLAAAPLVAELLASCPRLVVLATSRAPLRLAAEHEVPVPPLALPAAAAVTPDTLLAAPAVALFCARARAVRPDFALNDANAVDVAAICRRLDGLPLALELAATRVRALPPAALRSRLDHSLDLLSAGPRDAPARQRTLRETIAWSAGLLSEPQQVLFRRLAVFAGGCPLAAAEAVCNPDGELGLATLDSLTALLEHSLLLEREGADGEPRFAMLETIRAFAAEQLAASGEAEAIRERHALYFLAALERHGSFLGIRSLPAPVMAWLDGEQNNMRTALAWGLAAAERSAVALRLIAGLEAYWNMRGNFSEGWRAVNAGLDAGGHAPSAVRGAAHAAASNLAWFQTDYATARAHAETALALFRDAGDRPGVAHGLGLLSSAESMLGHLTEGRSCAEESVARWRSLKDDRGLSVALNILVLAARLEQDYAVARAAAGEQLALARKLGDVRLAAFALRQLGRIAFEEDDLAEAHTLLEDGLAEYRRQADPWQMGATLLDLANVPLAAGDGVAGYRYGDEALRLAEQVAAPGMLAAALHILGNAERLIGDPVQAAKRYADSIDGFLVASARRYATFCVAGIAGCALALGRPAEAARLLGAAKTLPTTRSVVIDRTTPALYERDVAAARAALGEAAFAAAWAAGEALSLDATIAEAKALAHDLRNSAAVPAHPDRAARSGPPTGYPDGLSAREVEVLQLIAAGKSTREIAAALVIAEGTVERHVTNLYGKIGARNRAEATSYAHAHGLIEPRSP